MKKKKKMADRTVEEVYESMEESRMDRLLGQDHDVIQDNDLRDRTIEEVYESMEESRMDRSLETLRNLDKPDEYDYLFDEPVPEDGPALLGLDVEPEVPAKVRRKTSRPKPKRKPKRKR